MAPPSLHAQTTTITRLYIAALTLVALLSIGGQLLVQYALRTQQSDATVINVAGRQRMLSQNIVKTALRLASDLDDSQRQRISTELQSLLSQWKVSHHGLQHGSTELHLPRANSPQVRWLFEKIDPVYSSMCFAAEQIIAEPRVAASRQSLAVLIALDPRFLDQMEHIVTQFDREATNRVIALQRIELTLLVVTLIVLAAEGMIIFRPAVRRLQSTAASLVAAQESQRAAQEVAERANLEKGRFLGNISHELRTPLHAIRGYVELLRQSSLTAEQEAKLDIIDDASGTLVALADDLLDLARIDAGKLEVKITAVPLIEAIQACLDLVCHLANEKQLPLRFAPESAGNNRCVLADPLRLRQVILNLLTNAVKYTHAGFIEIQLKSIAENQRVRISICDTGVGIASADQQRVFEAFQQIENASQPTSGAGLGLAICRRLADAMNGSLTLESSTGHGSTFTLELPLDNAIVTVSSPADVVTKSPVENNFLSRSLNVLVVDDDAVNCQLLQAALIGWGHQPLVLQDARQALPEVMRQSFDVALIDLQMPFISGRELAAELRRQFEMGTVRAFPIWAVSAARNSETGNDAERFDLCLLKPLELADLKLRLQQLTNAPDTSTSSEEPNFQKTLARCRGNTILLNNLIETFLIVWPDNKQKWEQAIVASDAREIRRILHLWRGQLLQFDAHEVLQYIDRWYALSTDVEFLNAIITDRKSFEMSFQHLLDSLRLFHMQSTLLSQQSIFR